MRDLTEFLLDRAEAGDAGTYDTVGPVVPFGEWVRVCREVGGHTGEVVPVPATWLVEQEVEQFMGPDSLAMWLVEDGWEGWSCRSGAAARAAGLRHRPVVDLLTGVLAYERAQGLDRPRSAGLSPERERSLLSAYRG